MLVSTWSLGKMTKVKLSLVKAAPDRRSRQGLRGTGSRFCFVRSPRHSSGWSGHPTRPKRRPDPHKHLSFLLLSWAPPRTAGRKLPLFIQQSMSVGWTFPDKLLQEAFLAAECSLWETPAWFHVLKPRNNKR